MIGPKHSAPAAEPNGFDKLARAYRWMEYLTFGLLLWRTRTAFLTEMLQARRALMLGDGDGRFTAALLRRNRNVEVCCVDASGAMLRALKTRAERQGDGARVQTFCPDVGESLPEGTFDLVCSHFFLDCFTDAECLPLVRGLASRMAPDAAWVVSEFAAPPGLLRLPARMLLWALYFAFRMLTGLRVRTLPDYATAMGASGLECAAVQQRMRGLLRAEMWRKL